jgi:hypothetical protein
MQIDLRLDIARLLARIQKHRRELDAKVDVVRAAGPLPSVGHLLALLLVGHDLVGVETVSALEALVYDEAAVDDVVEELSFLLVETLPQRSGEALTMRVGIAAARQQPTLTARSRHTVHHTGSRNRMSKCTLAIACKEKAPSTSSDFHSAIF